MTGPDPKADLHHYLQVAREALLWKLEGLSEYDIRRPLTPTGTNLLGLVKHAASVELGYNDSEEDQGGAPPILLVLSSHLEHFIICYSTTISKGQTTADASPARDAVLSATGAFVGLAARSLAEVSDDVSLTQYRVLVLLDAHDPLPMGRLAASLGVTPSTVTRMCDVLVHKGLIRRQPAPDNRRTVRAELTAGGRRLVNQVTARRFRLISAALARMTPDARDRFTLSMSEFAEAAGDLPDLAWTLGWSIDP